MKAMFPLFTLAAMAATAAASSEVVLKYSHQGMVYGSEGASSSQSATPLALARHVLETLALQETVIPVDPLPVAADLFRHSHAYGFVVLEGMPSASDVEVEKGDFSFQKSMPLADSEATASQVPNMVHVVASEFAGKYASSAVKCAGKSSFCTQVGADAIPADATLVHALWQEPSLAAAMDSKNPVDQRVMEELASVQTMVRGSTAANSKELFIASVSDLSELDAAKRPAVYAAVQNALAGLEHKLKTHYKRAGMQVLKLTRPLAPSMESMSAVTSLSRRALSSIQQQAVSNAAVPSNSSSNSSAPLTIESIAEFQIILWSSIILVFIVVLAVTALCGMDASRDSLLYAKFITDASNRKND